MEKAYKRVPFDIELVKKIQAGEIEGKILHNDEDVIILDYNSKVHSRYPIRFAYAHFDEIDYASIEGIHIELPYSDNKPQFNSFDKVLVRNFDKEEWEVSYFSHISHSYGDISYVAGNLKWRQCIPYEGHEHLVGTTDKPE